MKFFYWLMNNLGKHQFLTYDKFAHGWLHTILVRILINIRLSPGRAFIIALCLGIAYEICDYLFYVVERKGNKRYIIDCIYDIIWNLFGQIIGILI